MTRLPRLTAVPAFSISRYFYLRRENTSGNLRYRTQGDGSSRKADPAKKRKAPRLATHKGLIKRVRIVGPRHARRFKFKAPGLHHKLRKWRARNLKNKKKPRYISAADMPRVKKLLPYFKRQKFKFRH